MMGGGIAILAVLPSLERETILRSPLFRPGFKTVY
jgi:hypothetical protein